jgi:hypothetical protein
MARLNTLFRLSLTVVFVFIVVACDRSPSRSPMRVEPKRPITFAEARFMRVVPVVDGGAYGCGVDGGRLVVRRRSRSDQGHGGVPIR